MRIGVNAWVWTSPFTLERLDLIQKARRMGFDSFEIPLEDPAVLEPGRVKAALDQAGLRPLACGAFGPDRDLTHEDGAIRINALAYLEQSIRFCSAIGAKLLAGPMYSAVGKRRHLPPEQRRAEWQRAVQGLRAAGKIASDAGVVLAVEPLNRFETDLVNTCQQCVALVQEIGSDSVRIHLDTFHMNIEEHSLLQAIRLAGPRLAHLHACENDRGTPGSGPVRWDELASGLKEIGYQGDVVIESFTPECQVIAAAAAIWRPLAPSQDRLAAAGLAFLRKLLG